MKRRISPPTDYSVEKHQHPEKDIVRVNSLLEVDDAESLVEEHVWNVDAVGEGLCVDGQWG